MLRLGDRSATRLLRFARNDDKSDVIAWIPPGRRHAPPEDKLRDEAVSIGRSERRKIASPRNGPQGRPSGGRDDARERNGGAADN